MTNKEIYRELTKRLFDLTKGNLSELDWNLIENIYAVLQENDEYRGFFEDTKEKLKGIIEDVLVNKGDNGNNGNNNDAQSVSVAL